MDEREVKEEFLKRFLADEPLEGLHASMLVYDCSRRIWYNYNERPEFDLRTRIKMAIGRELHRKPIYTEHENELEWNGVKFTIDEFDPERGIILDKKFTWNRDLSSLPYPRDVKQVRYYVVAKEKNGQKVAQIFLVYLTITMTDDFVHPFEVPIPTDPEAIAKEIQEKAAVARSDSIPRPDIGRECEFCPFATASHCPLGMLMAAITRLGRSVRSLMP